MTIGPITHAGSNWRKLCRSYNLDPMTATAADVERAVGASIRQAVGASCAGDINQELLTACSAAEARLLGEDENVAAMDESPWVWNDEFTGDMQDAYNALSRAMANARPAETRP